ncbi:type II toxin-antitoxin system Phd/YefM family antitoxin [Streptomyces europaeiscabiei]|uniref:type II toxin-antitoxin system Phd/YefM family antitoxin n=1 Tax=Streptomyces europaeiscabiei TaxID=146819 RepID=UPI0029ADC637|nr:type II toxin-antitoxin system Phd/YefM family antitoxin [Streptomyces europaeiscabiei]MDX3860050.1 type II toxin-antitoxin system Phd/YefM family antitoxin [Streptomyces europaeiscabiei]
MAKSISTAGLRARLAAVLDAVRGGSTYAVMRHGVAVAYIVPPDVVAAAGRSDRLAGQLAQLEERLSTAESDRSAAQMAALEAEQRLKGVQDELDTTAEDLANLRADHGLDGMTSAQRRAARRRR